MGSEYLLLLFAATQNARENHGYLDSTHVQVMTGRSAERENTSIMEVNPKTLLQKPGKEYIEAGTT